VQLLDDASPASIAESWSSLIPETTALSVSPPDMSSTFAVSSSSLSTDVVDDTFRPAPIVSARDKEEYALLAKSAPDSQAVRKRASESQSSDVSNSDDSDWHVVIDEPSTTSTLVSNSFSRVGQQSEQRHRAPSFVFLCWMQIVDMIWSLFAPINK
jgi:hypothetical protein